ncbi:hypothetical protein B0H13DRAFT_1865719 [Mycena leptocephala]|nr:hypothetical protein B0H13DRAFT_1865719 [Mycena leptocephala]
MAQACGLGLAWLAPGLGLGFLKPNPDEAKPKPSLHNITSMASTGPFNFEKPMCCFHHFNASLRTIDFHSFHRYEKSKFRTHTSLYYSTYLCLYLIIIIERSLADYIVHEVPS